MLQEEKSILEAEKEQIQNSTNAEAEDDQRSSTMIRHNQMVIQIEELQEETYKFVFCESNLL